MSDTCKHCMVRGNIIECRATPCHTHVSWYAQQQQAEIERLRDALELLLISSDDIYPGDVAIARAALAGMEVSDGLLL